MKKPIGEHNRWGTAVDLKALHRALVLAALVLLPARDVIRASDIAGPWIQVNRPIVSVQLGFVTYSDGNYYTGGSDGMFLSSTDGKTWVQRDAGYTNYLGVGAAGGGKVVVYGGDSFAVSADGIGWQQVPQPSPDAVAALGFGNGVFVAVGYSGSIATSTNGLDWVIRRQSDGWENFLEVCHGQAGFVALSGRGIFHSATGEQWDKVYTVIAGTPKHCVYGQGAFLASDENGDLYSSSDGRSWQLTGKRLPSPATKLLWDGIQFIAVMTDSAQAYVSTDGGEWSPLRSPTSISVWDAVSAGGKLVMVGRGGGIVSGLSMTNLDTASAGIYGSLSGIAAGPPGVVTVGIPSGSYRVAFSPDGFSWRGLPLSLSSRPTFVRYSRNRFLVGGEKGGVWTSTDGQQWSAAPINRSVPLRGMATDGQTEVLVGGQSVLLYSTNGVDWVPATGGHNENAITYHSVVWGGGKWVCFGQDTGSGTFILLSTDGKAWTRSYLKDTLLNGATYGDGRFVGVGDYGIVVTSPDGLTWEREPPPLPDRLLSVTFHQGWFVATVVPARGDTVLPGVLLSTNAVEWVAGPVQVRRGRGLRASGTSGDTLWVAGDDGMIFRAGSIQAPTIGLERVGPVWRCSLASPQRVDALLEVSEDLLNWQPGTLIVNLRSQFDFQLAPSSAASREFFKAVVR